MLPIRRLHCQPVDEQYSQTASSQLADQWAIIFMFVRFDLIAVTDRLTLIRLLWHFTNSGAEYNYWLQQFRCIAFIQKCVLKCNRFADPADYRVKYFIHSTIATSSTTFSHNSHHNTSEAPASVFMELDWFAVTKLAFIRNISTLFWKEKKMIHTRYILGKNLKINKYWFCITGSILSNNQDRIRFRSCYILIGGKIKYL